MFIINPHVAATIKPSITFNPPVFPVIITKQ